MTVLEAETPPRAVAAPARRLPRLAGPWPLVLAAIGLVGFTVRFQLESRGGGFFGIGAYDDGVYYAAADQLLHGRLPYRDYLFLQPPGIVLALTPVAALGRLLGDAHALVALRVLFELIGGLNAALVAANLRRFGPAAAVTGGVFYAVFFPAVYDERTALLEPLGTTGLLVGVLLVGLVRDGRLGRGALVWAGVALGVAVDLKIWFIVALLIVTAFAGRGRLRVLVGGGVAVVAVYLPFFLAAPSRSFTQIVLDQLGRPTSSTLLKRLESLLGVDGVATHTSIPHVSAAILGLVLVGVCAAVTALALLDSRAWLYVALLVGAFAIALSAPSYFLHYASLTAPPIALVLGVATGRVACLLRRRPLRISAVALVLLAVAGLNVRHDLEPTGERVPVAALQQAGARVPGCILSDDPTLLAVMNVLTRDLDAGCAVQVDTSGISFDKAGQPADGRRVSRPRNAVYQAEVVRALRAGDAFLAVRHNTALSTASRADLARNPVLFRAGRFVLRAGGTPR